MAFVAPSCANLLARNADRGEGRRMWTAKDPALVIVLAAEEGVLMLKETRGCGLREKQLKDERVIPRHVWGELDVADVTITTGCGIFRIIFRSAEEEVSLEA